MPLTKKEKDELKDIEREYLNKGYSKKRAWRIARAVVYTQKRKLEKMQKVSQSIPQKEFIRYKIVAKKKGKGQKVEVHEALNTEAKDLIVAQLRADNYKVEVIERKRPESATSKLFEHLSKL